MISGPYSSVDETVKKQRVKAIADACLLVTQSGNIPVSPLLFGLTLIEKSGQNLPDSYEFWDNFCRQYVLASEKILVLDLEGWETSNGVKDEIKVAKENNIPVYLVNPHNLEEIRCLSCDIAEGVEYSVTDFLVEEDEDYDHSYYAHELYQSTKTRKVICLMKNEFSGAIMCLEGVPDMSATHTGYMHNITDKCVLSSDYQLIHKYDN